MRAPCLDSCRFAPLVVFAATLLLADLPVLGSKLRDPSQSPALPLSRSENCSSSVATLPPSVTTGPFYLLHFRYTFFLEVNQRGRILGSLPTRKNANLTMYKMEVESVGSCLIRIKSSTGRYLAYKNVTSELYTQENPTLDAVFRYHVDANGYALQSYQYRWYVGIKSSGRPKKGKKVRLHHPSLFAFYSPDQMAHFLKLYFSGRRL